MFAKIKLPLNYIKTKRNKYQLHRIFHDITQVLNLYVIISPFFPDGETNISWNLLSFKLSFQYPRVYWMVIKITQWTQITVSLFFFTQFRSLMQKEEHFRERFVHVEKKKKEYNSEYI